jgi:hypothetical protein
MKYPMWGGYLWMFVFTVGFALVWHFRKKIPGIDDAGGYGSMYTYAAPMFAAVGLVFLSILALDCFFRSAPLFDRPQPAVLAAIHPVLIVVTVAATLRWHYGSWRFGSREELRRANASRVAWLSVSVAGGLGVLVTGLMCLLDHAAAVR